MMLVARPPAVNGPPFLAFLAETRLAPSFARGPAPPTAPILFPDLKTSNLSPDDDLRPAQRLLFWRIAASGGRLWLKSLTPVPKPAVRRGLEHRRLIAQERARDPQTGRDATRLEITPKGWNWARTNMRGPFAATPAAAETLSVLLETISRFGESRGLLPRDLLVQSEAVEQKPRPNGHAHHQRAEETLPNGPDEAFEAEFEPDPPSQMIDAGIVRQIVTLVSGRSGVGVPLTRLRRQMEIDREELDESLQRLRSEGRIELVPRRDLGKLTAEDRAAALLDEQGKPYHEVQLAPHFDVAY